MFDIDPIASQVKHNCNISDAQYWGYYTPCGLLLRMRDLYKIENGLRPWDKVDHKKVSEWIGNREKHWGEISEQAYRAIEINGKKFDPYDVSGVNSLINRHGFLYGAGYGNLLKPVFLLAEIAGKTSDNSYNVYITGREKARCLSTSPAMAAGNRIIVRQETMEFFFWDKFEEMKARKCDGALYHAFSEYGISKAANRDASAGKFDRLFSGLVSEEINTLIHHERGEISQRRVLGRWWKDLLLKVPYGRAELLLRAMKDVLSDTSAAGMLSYIVKEKKAGSLHFFIALHGGYRRMIFPEVVEAYEEFLKTQDWGIIDQARNKGYTKVKGLVRKLRGLYDRGDISPESIEKVIC